MIRISAHGKKAQQLAWQIYDLIEAQQTLRTTTADIVLEAREGRLILNGRVRTNTLRDLAQRLAQSAADGWELQNNLISDDALAVSLSARLASDPRAATADVRCEVFLGAAYLKGAVYSPEQRAAVLELARNTPGIVVVHDLLTITR